jgi:hypothetical protein
VLDAGDAALPASGPLSVLDAGSGVGVLGVCAAGALSYPAAPGGASRALRVRAQDRDELARLFTEYNARRNGLGPEILEAHTEPLLGGPEGARWDLILSNLPAKAGSAVLEDFVFRAPALLGEGGMALVVAVAPLGDFLAGRMAAARCGVFLDEGGAGYRVLGFRPAGGPGPEGRQGTVRRGPGFFGDYPAYLRGGGDYELSGLRYHLDATEGAAGFDNPGAAVRAAVRLWVKLKALKKTGKSFAGGATGALLVHEPDQGHFPVWLARSMDGGAKPRFVLSGRNVLALEAAAWNLRKAAGLAAATVPAADPETGLEALLREGPYAGAVLFPDTVPGTDRIAAHWEALGRLLEPGGLALAALPSSQAERFARQKPRNFSALGDLRREGFRALAFRLNSAPPPGQAGRQNP